MAKLAQFSIPANVADPTSGDLTGAWHDMVASIVSEQSAAFPQLYDPTAVDTPANAQLHRIPWHAFPATLNRKTASARARAELADGDRDNQDEYCEWSVERDGEDITKVSFTTEVPEYYSTLAQVDPEALLSLYHELVSPDVLVDELLSGGEYDPVNAWNRRTDGPIMHLCQTTNTLGAAIVLAAQATVLRQRDGIPVTDQQDLVICGGLGGPFRNSDPQIAAAINGLAATGVRLTLEDPIGLYIDRFETAGMRFPNGVDPDECWIAERGDADHTVRARFQLPPGKGTVSDVTIDGAPIRFGAQLADRVVIRIGARSHSPGSLEPQIKGCEPPV